MCVCLGVCFGCREVVRVGRLSWCWFLFVMLVWVFCWRCVLLYSCYWFGGVYVGCCCLVID